MPVNYQLPPWIRGAETAQAYARGFPMGAQLAEAAARMNEARARLASDAQRTQVELQMRQEQQQRESLQRQQELEVLKAYQQEQIKLKQEQMDQQQQRIDQAAKIAAQRYAAYQDYQRAISSGTPYEKAILMYGPGMGQQGAVESAAIRAMSKSDMPEVVAEEFRTDTGDFPYLRNTRTGAVHWPPRPMQQRAAVDKPETWAGMIARRKELGLTKEQETDLRKLYDNSVKKQLDLAGQTPTPPAPPEPKNWVERLFSKAPKVDAAATNAPAAPTAAGEAPSLDTPIKLPGVPGAKFSEVEKQLLAGQTYVTPKGLAKWNAESKKFETVEPAYQQSQEEDMLLPYEEASDYEQPQTSE